MSSSFKSYVGYLFALVLAVSLLLSCSGMYYDVLYGLSPEELVARSETVVLGRFIESDTVAFLGTEEYRGDSCNFAVVEYRFQPFRLIKCGDPGESVYLWNYGQCCKDSCYDTFDFVPGNVYLVYGTVIDSVAELSDVARPTLLGYHPEHEFTDWDRADSVFASELPSSPTLSSLLNARNQNCIVLAGTDADLMVLFLYSTGDMAFTDSTGSIEMTTRQDYLKRVEVAAGWKKGRALGDTAKVSPYAAYAEILKRVLDAEEFQPYFLADYDSVTQPITIVDDIDRGELPPPKLSKFGRSVRFMDKATADSTGIGRYYFLGDYIVVDSSARVQLFDKSRDLLLNAILECRNMRWEIEGTNVQGD